MAIDYKAILADRTYNASAAQAKGGGSGGDGKFPPYVDSFGPGKYTFEIQSVKAAKGRGWAELLVLSSSNPNVAVGSKATLSEGLEDPTTGGPSRWRDFVFAAPGTDPAKFDEFEVTIDGKARVYSGEAGRKIWLGILAHAETQPLAFVPIELEMKPKEKNPKYCWQNWKALLGPDTFEAVNAKRAAAKLPSLEDALKG